MPRWRLAEGFPFSLSCPLSYVDLFGKTKKGLVTFRYTLKYAQLRLCQRGKYLVSPVESGLFVDLQLRFDRIQALLRYHKFQIIRYLFFLVEPGHPGACVFRKVSLAALTFVTLRAFVPSETNVFPMTTMRAGSLLVVQQLSSD